MIQLAEFEGMIKRLAWECFRKLPRQYLTLEEVEQEGRIVFVRLLRKRLKAGGATFSTVLYRSLQNRYRDLVREAYTVKRSHERTADQVEECFDRLIPSPEEMVELKQFLDYVRRVDGGLWDFFLSGPSEDLERFAKERHFRRMRTEDSEGSLISLGCIEEFFGVSFSKLLRNFKFGRVIRRSMK